MLGHERLDEDRAPLGIEPRGNPVGHVVVRVLDERRRVGVLARQRVPVGDEVEAVVLVLQRHPVLERAHQVTEMQFARRAHARDNARFHINHVSK